MVFIDEFSGPFTRLRPSPLNLEPPLTLKGQKVGTGFLPGTSVSQTPTDFEGIFLTVQRPDPLVPDLGPR